MDRPGWGARTPEHFDEELYAEARGTRRARESRSDSPSPSTQSDHSDLYTSTPSGGKVKRAKEEESEFWNLADILYASKQASIELKAKNAKEEGQWESSWLPNFLRTPIRTSIGRQPKTTAKNDDESETVLSLLDTQRMPNETLSARSSPTDECFTNRSQWKDNDRPAAPGSYKRDRWWVPVPVHGPAVNNNRSILRGDELLYTFYKKCEKASNNLTNSLTTKDDGLFSPQAYGTPYLPLHDERSRRVDGDTSAEDSVRDFVDPRELEKTPNTLCSLTRERYPLSACAPSSANIISDSNVINYPGKAPPGQSFPESFFRRANAPIDEDEDELEDDPQNGLGDEPEALPPPILPTFEPEVIPVVYKFRPYQDDTDDNDMDHDIPDFSFDTPTKPERFDLHVGLARIPDTEAPCHPFIIYLWETIASGRPTPEHRVRVMELSDTFKQLHIELQRIAGQFGCRRLFRDPGDYEYFWREVQRVERAFCSEQRREVLDLLGRLAHLEWQVIMYGQESGCFETGELGIDASLTFKQRCMWNMGQRASLARCEYAESFGWRSGDGECGSCKRTSGGE